jgi:hypothetical protein
MSFSQVISKSLFLALAPEMPRSGLLRKDQATPALVGLDDLQRKALADVVAQRVGTAVCSFAPRLQIRGELREGV